MNIFIWWIVMGISLIIAEIMSGTLYLLFIGIGFLFTSLLAYYNFEFLYQVIFLAIYSVITIYLVYAKNKANRKKKNENNFELGKIIFVSDWQGNNTRVLYKGAYWDAKYAAQDDYPIPLIGEYEIIDMQGNLLLLKYKI